jgi:cell division protein FtsW
VATLTPPRGWAESKPASEPRHSAGAWLGALLDRPLTSYHLVLGATAILLALGVLMVLSASSVSAYLKHHDSYFYVKRQAIFLGAGLLGALLLMKLPPAKLRVLSWFGIALALILLILTYTPLGIEVKGNRNWLDIGVSSFSIQPAEFAKLAMIVWGAELLARKRKLLDQPKHLLVPYLPVCGLLILLVVFQGDAGTAVVLVAIAVGVLWIVGAPMRVLAGLGVTALAGVVALFVTSPVRMRRLAAFIDPTAQLNGANDQANAGMYAIASGGWWGVGLGASRQKWGSLPEAHTDFIFAVIGERYGFMGAALVLSLYALLFWRALRITTLSKNAYGTLVAGGIAVSLLFQTFVNVGMNLGIMPITGIPLPLMSYGGSSVLATFLAIGVLQSINVQAHLSQRGRFAW